MKRLVLTTAILIGWAAPAWAGLDEVDAAYERGDYETALRELRPLANQGNAGAQVRLGALYRKGHGVPQDYAEAAKWYRRAANHGSVRAQTILGLMYFRGQGVPEDYVQAHMWASLSAAPGGGSAASLRDTVAKRMTPAQIAKAQRLAREWKPKKEGK